MPPRPLPSHSPLLLPPLTPPPPPLTEIKTASGDADADVWPDHHWIDEAFDQRFWLEYPRKTHKAEAKVAWRKLMKRQPCYDVAMTLAEQMLEVLVEQADAWTDPRLTPHAATYINGERWTDEQIIPTTRSNGHGRAVQRWPA